MLDAPNLLDDYCWATNRCKMITFIILDTNLLDWSKTNIVAVALGNKIFQWNAGTGNVDELMDFEEVEAQTTLVKWSKEGKYIAIGFSDGQLKVL